MGWFANESTDGAAPTLPASPHRWVVVDVETSGRSAAAHRVLSVAALALDERGRPEQAFKQAPASIAAAAPPPNAAPPARVRVPGPRPRAPLGPMSRRRVLVLGGPHERAAAIREAVIARGGAAAINLSANVTEILVLDGADGDRRIARAEAAGVPIHRDPAGLGIHLGEPRPDVSAESGTEPDTPSMTDAGPVSLGRGAVTDLPAGDVWTVNVAWRADALAARAEIDVVAFVVAANHRVESADSTAATATLDAATTERSMLLAEIYRRDRAWRVRAEGQGYDHGLAELAIRHGVELED